MKPRLLIIGCGDVLTRALPWLQKRFRIYILTHKTSLSTHLPGITQLWGDLDKITTLTRLARLGHYIIYAAPPKAVGDQDSRVGHIIRVVSRIPKKRSILAQSLRHVVYISTSGVYGDCAGKWIDETRPPRPQSERAQRRLDAEKKWRHFAKRQQVGLTILRVPGIYAANRLPLSRLKMGMPIIAEAEDSFSNHIHADDLAHITSLALFRAPALRIYHASDALPMKMGAYFAAVASATGLPLPIALPRKEVQLKVSLASWSFMQESRQLSNIRLKELRIRLRYPTVHVFLQEYKMKHSLI
jgi:nucleoside-diphosphate-sugar epimerase